nr:iron chelate uptake ABC transporter family permease subunit [Kibdelosporangium sp. MJ126-NF4]CEL21563.1 ABC-type Fe3+-siderophore transport system, permease component [Kibdelosporangium sp. MJ126-NF4]CTQ95869.1 ABC-type Fe3+-siderophore transport system, permease component [Kibdelosporangium sp. MJ126-NF4]
MAADPSRQRRHALRVAGLVVVVALIGLVALLSLAVGAKHIPPGVVWNALWHFDGSYDAGVIWDQRMPRTLLGLAVGGALGLAGAVMQALTRNPLADPGLLGVNAGASAAVVTSIVLFGFTRLVDYVWFAFAGAAVAGVLVYLLGISGRGRPTPVRLVLAGTVVWSILVGVISGLTTVNVRTWDLMRFWTLGSLINRGTDVLYGVLPFLVIGMLVALTLGPGMNAIALGEETGTSLGANVGRLRVLACLSIVLLCGGATAAAGPIAFVGLAVPHAVKAVVGHDNRWILLYSLLTAPVLLLGSDVLGRVVLGHGELEVGIVTVLVGAPVFIYLVRRKVVTQ